MLGAVCQGIESCMQYSIDSVPGVTMSVRLNITMDEDVYSRLKKAVPPKKLSAFISGAVRAKLHPDAKALNAAYQAASKERWRTNLDQDWKHVDDEGWPK
jgi:hypothetical protein